jgi:TatD DNase family protein
LAIAADARLPVIIHQRNAAEDLIAELDRWPNVALIVLHSFDGTPRLRDWAVERGCFVGIGGLAAKTGSQGLRDLLRTIPMERLLLETDSPYLPPPHATSRRNAPANLGMIAGELAPVWSIEATDLCRVTSANAAEAFGLSLDLAAAVPAAASAVHQS